MKIISISYKQKFPIGQFLNADIGFEVQQEQGESVNDVLLQLKGMAEAFHRQEFPQMYATPLLEIDQDFPPPETSQSTYAKRQQKPENRVQSIIQDIETVRELTVLESYRLIAKANPEIQEAYNNKLKQLQ